MSYQKSDKSDCDELRQMLPEFAAGALTAEEVKRVKALLEDCPEVQQELAEYIAASAAFYERIDPIEPPNGLHDKLLAKVRAANGTHTQVSQRSTTSAAPQSENDILRQQRNTLANYLCDPDLNRIPLVDPSNTTIAVLLCLPDSRSALLISTNFPRAQRGARYHLWLISDEQRYSAGIFNMDESDFVMFNVILNEPMSHFQQVVITREQDTHSGSAGLPIAQGKIEFPL